MKDLNKIENELVQPISNTVIHETNKVSVIGEQSNPVQVLAMISDLVKRENFDIHALEKLIALQNQSEDRQAKRAFDMALSEMMAEIPVIAKTGVNSFNGTTFAKLEDIVETTRPILNKHGFAVTYTQEQEMMQGAKFDVGSIFCMMTVTCHLKHSAGHQESNSTVLPIATIKGQTPIQAMGMGSTYGRRYTLMQALNIATAGTDNDGSIASFAHVASAQKKPIKNERLAQAIEKSKAGELDLIRQVLEKYELTEEQKDFLNGQLFTGVAENG